MIYPVDVFSIVIGVHGILLSLMTIENMKNRYQYCTGDVMNEQYFFFPLQVNGSNRYDLFESLRQHIIGRNEALVVTEREFLRREYEEIRRYQTHYRDFTNDRAMMWVQCYAEVFRDLWRPFVFKKEKINDVIREIKKHRWIESERAGKDLGAAAELHWIVYFSLFFK